MKNDSMIIKNARVIRPDTGTIQDSDLYIRDGRLVEDITNQDDRIPVLDIHNCFVAPGFVDLHTHVFKDHMKDAITPDEAGITLGVITVVDAGSTGIRDYPIFEQEFINKSTTDVRFFLNIARKGLCDGLSELADPEDLMTADELDAFIKQHGQRLAGLKVRMSSSIVKDQGIAPLLYGRKLADQFGLPLMVHIGNRPPELGEVLNILKRGDIVTHCFHGKKGGITDYPHEFKKAASRGVRFDVGHGTASFSYHKVSEVLKLQPVDFSISTDLYAPNIHKPVGSLMLTMSKFLHMGYSVSDLVRRVTVLPREILRMEPVNMSPGDPADLTVFKIVEKQRKLVDSEGYEIDCNRYLEPVAAIKQGKRVWNCE